MPLSGQRVKRALLSICAGALTLLLGGCGVSLPFFETEEMPVDAGYTLLASHEYKEALDRFMVAVSQGEDSVELYRGIGIANKHLGSYAQAEEAFVHALAGCGGIPGAMTYDTAYYLAETYEAQNKTEEAIRVYDAILDLSPSQEDALYLRGLAYLSKGDHEHATEDFTSVTEHKPLQYDRVFAVYDALSGAGYAPEAKRMLTDIYTANEPGMTDYEKGRFAAYLGSLEDAKTYLQKAYDSEDLRTEDKIPIAILLGEVAQELGDDAYAVSVYRRYLQEDQSRASIYHALGVCEMRMGSYTDALSDFQIGLSLNDTDQNPALLRGITAAYEYLGNFDLAAEKMAEYLALVPTDEEAQRENIFLTTRMLDAEEGTGTEPQTIAVDIE